jgi:hypothetical protein
LQIRQASFLPAPRIHLEATKEGGKNRLVFDSSVQGSNACASFLDVPTEQMLLVVADAEASNCGQQAAAYP